MRTFGSPAASLRLQRLAIHIKGDKELLGTLFLRDATDR